MPTGRGGNLTQPLKKVLINVPSADNLGAFADAAGTRFLQFKQHGYTLPATGGETVAVTQPQAPVRKVAVVALNNVAPVDPTNYNYGITVKKRVRKPGIDNSDFFPHQKFYGGTLPVVTSPNIAAGELTAMRLDILDQINGDLGYIRKFDYQHPGAAVVASSVLHLDTWDNDSAITLDGNAAAAEATIGAFLANINAIDGYFAWLNPAAPAEEIFVIKTTRDVDPSADIVFAQTAGTIDAAAVQPAAWVALTSRYDDVTFEVVTNASIGAVDTIRATTFAFLTPDEVQQIFSHIPNDGHLAAERRRPNQVLNVPYVKINIDIPQQHYDLHGASHGVMFITAVEVYMPAAEWNIAAGAAVNERWATAAGAPLRMMDPGTDDNVRDLFDWWTP